MSYSASPDGSLADVRRSIAAAREEAEELVRTGAPSPAPPDSVPGYTILREIGRGGMGVVYETEQRQPQRTVALKVMSGGETADVHRLPLFLQEVQTLARLNHPGIAGIYGAGCTDDGRPYFAMELVRGQRLADYVRSRQLAVRDRLRLFQRVCEAVHYAHQRGVIHRDLKPSNIIVEAAGHPKVLDFGLAGLTDPDGALRHSPSDVGRIVGTRPYMSPEQARGRPDEIDVRTDVYALGVILYELLTDALPYDVPPGDRDDAWPAVYQQPFRRPSAVRRLPRDLDWIVLKTLASDPAQRYQSVAALGEDLERLLTGRPIQARAPSALYLLRKWVARHRAAAAYLASLAGLVIAFGVWVGHMDAEASRQQLFEKDRQLAVARFRLDMTKQHQRELAVIERERDTARQIQRFWENLVVSAGRLGEVTEAGVRTFLDQAARRVESELSGQPEAAAAIYDTLGLGYAQVGRYDTAVEHLRRALTIRRKLFGDRDPRVADTLERLATALLAQGNLAMAELVFRECLGVRRAAYDDNHVLTACTESLLGECLTGLGRYDEAERLLLHAYPLLRDQPGADPEPTLAAARRLVKLYEAWGKPDEAARWRTHLNPVDTQPTPVP